NVPPSAICSSKSSIWRGSRYTSPTGCGANALTRSGTSPNRRMTLPSTAGNTQRGASRPGASLIVIPPLTSWLYKIFNIQRVQRQKEATEIVANGTGIFNPLGWRSNSALTRLRRVFSRSLRPDLDLHRHDGVIWPLAGQHALDGRRVVQPDDEARRPGIRRVEEGQLVPVLDHLARHPRGERARAPSRRAVMLRDQPPISREQVGKDSVINRRGAIARRLPVQRYLERLPRRDRLAHLGAQQPGGIAKARTDLDANRRRIPKQRALLEPQRRRDRAALALPQHEVHIAAHRRVDEGAPLDNQTPGRQIAIEADRRARARLGVDLAAVHQPDQRQMARRAIVFYAPAQPQVKGPARLRGCRFGREGLQRPA